LITILLALRPSAAQATTLSFDQLQVGEGILEYYNGGLGSMGTGPGPSLGVSFTPVWTVSTPDVYGAANGKSAAFSGMGTVSFHAEWSGAFSFYYSGGPTTLQLYSEENGLGTLHDTLNLPASSEFQPIGGLGAFRSLVFTSTGSSRIDVLTNEGFVIPEPAAAQLFGIGLLGFLVAWRRRGNLRF